MWRYTCLREGASGFRGGPSPRAKSALAAPFSMLQHRAPLLSRGSSLIRGLRIMRRDAAIFAKRFGPPRMYVVIKLWISQGGGIFRRCEWRETRFCETKLRLIGTFNEEI